MDEPIVWINRLKYSLAGSLVLMVLGSFALWESGKFADENVIRVILVELGYTVFCGFLASAIPARHAWECVFRGFMIPAILGAMMAAAVGNN